MKSILKNLLVAFTGFVSAALAAWAEFGRQEYVPGFKTASDYSALGSTRYIIVAALGTGFAYSAVQATDPTSSLILGVMQNEPKLGNGISIAYIGPSKVVAGGALNPGAIFTTNGSGRAAAVASGQMAVGRILEAAGADGDIVSALLFPPMRWTGAA